MLQVKLKTLVLDDCKIKEIPEQLKNLTKLTKLSLKHNKGIKHIILTPYVNEFSQYVNSDDLLNVDWGVLSNEYPECNGTHNATKNESIRNAIIKAYEENKHLLEDN